MLDREAFFRAVAANPDDDAPRLAFADYLDDQNEPEWAEFIRVQCELAGLPTHAAFPATATQPAPDPIPLGHVIDWFREREPIRSVLARRDELARREVALFGGGGIAPRYSQVAPGLLCNVGTHPSDADQSPVHQWAFLRRGFVERLHLPATDWFNHAKPILEANPVRHVELVELRGVIPSLAQKDRLAEFFRRRWPGVQFGVSEGAVRRYQADLRRGRFQPWRWIGQMIGGGQ
jgi:uncharacterized protein (TIGR02996 family)